jgi:hypothetical protein
VVRSPEGCHRFSDTRSGVDLFSIVVRWSTLRSDPGYYLTALQAAEAHPRPRGGTDLTEPLVVLRASAQTVSLSMICFTGNLMRQLFGVYSWGL